MARQEPHRVPQDFRNQLAGLHFAREFLVKRRWTLSEAQRKKHYVIIPSENLNRDGVLPEELREELDIPVPFFVAYLGKFKVHLKKRRGSGSYSLSGWSRIVDTYSLVQGTPLQLWAFRHQQSAQIGFALVILNQEMLEELRNARRFPAEIRNQTLGIGGAERILFIFEKILQRTDLRAGKDFNILKKDIENDYLRDDELGTLGEGCILIGPPIPGQEQELGEFVVVLKMVHNYLTISGDDWGNFVGRYNLQAGMRIRLWTFMMPNNLRGMAVVSYEG